MMTKKLANLSVIVTSLLGYLEWGGGQRSFLFQAEGEVMMKLFQDPLAAVHPFTVIPMFGQVLMTVTLFQKQPSKWLTRLGIISLAVLLGLMLAIGVLAGNIKMILSVIPFLAAAYWAMKVSQAPV